MRNAWETNDTYICLSFYAFAVETNVLYVFVHVFANMPIIIHATKGKYTDQSHCRMAMSQYQHQRWQQKSIETAIFNLLKNMDNLFNYDCGYAC